MSIKEKSLKIKGLAKNEAFLTLGILCVVAVLSFYTGRLSASGEPVTPTEKADSSTHIPMTMNENTSKSNDSLTHSSTTVVEAETKTTQTSSTLTTGKYVGSRKGTKYHLPTCSGAKTMSEENKIWFSSKEDAASKGYTPAANCKGI